MEISVGQRWVSDSEPELGLGMVLEIEDGLVDILFPSAEERRKYSVSSAPLRRVVFSKGDTIRTYDDQELEVLEVKNEGDVVIYKTAERQLEEGELHDSMALNKPQDRLLGGAVDDDRAFRLRVESIYRNSAIKGCKVRGLIGARTDLIPHQLSIVNEVAKRFHPRALLADEVGLGKTIEACLIMHRLHLTGRADRVLVLLPESLVHQWFVELLRRFNMLFSLFDEERCSAIEAHNKTNPFEDSQLVIASIDFLTNSSARQQQVIDAGWDMIIVDEAHHLEWSSEEVSPAYMLVDTLAQRTASVLLLTATPQQLGPEGHFARLRLLDRERFVDLDAYLKESAEYETLAKLLSKISKGDSPTAVDLKKFGKQSSRIQEGMKALVSGDESVRDKVVEDLLDSFGPGRVMFRNTRDFLQGFPNRVSHLVPLENEKAAKVTWLVELIQKWHKEEEKILLITQTKEQVETLALELQQRINVELAVFHEDLTLIQRDRNAAYFSTEDGAQLLLCSEIGSEGRNFQFAHHLVLYDLPSDPELLEQRIGRLDRIGQTGDIHIHVPYLSGTEGEVLARWYAEGLDAFEHNLHGATEVYRSCAEMLELLFLHFDPVGLDELIGFSKKQMKAVKKKLKSGQEKLLALNSFRDCDSQKVIERVKMLDEDKGFEKFMLRLFDDLGLGIEDMSDRTYVLSTSNMKTDLGGDIPDEGLAITFDRDKALSREDLQFMSIDHPLLRNAIDVFLSSETGNAGFGVWEGTGEKGIILEAFYVVEIVAPASLGVDRFLTARPIRVAVDHLMKDVSENIALKKVKLREGNLRKLLTNPALKQKLIPAMAEQCEKNAKQRVSELVASSQEYMLGNMTAEVERLEELAELNHVVSQQEIDGLKSQITQISDAIASARVRLDSLRMIWKT